VSRAVHERAAPEAVATRPRRRSATHLDGRELGAIFAGGFVGAAARAELGELLPHSAGGWPWATLLVNVAGAVLLGYAVTRLQERLPLSVYRRPFLGTGVCGGLTTFSTMQVELLQMLDAGRVGLALAYALVSVLAGFAGVAVATNLVRRTRLAA
jgi:CrcB protein